MNNEIVNKFNNELESIQQTFLASKEEQEVKQAHQFDQFASQHYRPQNDRAPIAARRRTEATEREREILDDPFLNYLVSRTIIPEDITDKAITALLHNGDVSAKLREINFEAVTDSDSRPIHKRLKVPESTVLIFNTSSTFTNWIFVL